MERECQEGAERIRTTGRSVVTEDVGRRGTCHCRHLEDLDLAAKGISDILSRARDETRWERSESRSKEYHQMDCCP
jgi:hypothetical protein